jgi:hypothetical protein
MPLRYGSIERSSTCSNPHQDNVERNPTSLDVGGISTLVNESLSEQAFSEFFLDYPYNIRYNITMNSRLEIRLDKDLHEFLKRYAKANHKSVTQVLVDYAINLRKRHGKNFSVQDLSSEGTGENA